LLGTQQAEADGVGWPQCRLPAGLR
jgi:hypothetical protein